MDIRDFTEEVIYPGKNSLGKMFELQLVLIDHYVDIEGLPEYPLDINTKRSQILLKDFISRIVEELGEAWESFEILMQARLEYQPEGNKNLIPHLQNFNEEIADALHFWLELLIFSDIGPEDICKGPVDELEELMGYYNLELKNDDPKPLPSIWVIRDRDLTDEFLRGGRQLGQARYEKMKQLLWDVTYHLQIARNTLKNKPWKQTGMMTDEALYKSKLLDASSSLFKFMAFCGFTKESIYTIYFKKNLANQFRIKSRY